MIGAATARRSVRDANSVHFGARARAPMIRILIMHACGKQMKCVRDRSSPMHIRRRVQGDAQVHSDEDACVSR